MEMSGMKASVIVLNRNGEAYLEECLSSVVEAILRMNDVDVTLADNGSTDRNISLTRRDRKH